VLLRVRQRRDILEVGHHDPDQHAEILAARGIGAVPRESLEVEHRLGDRRLQRRGGIVDAEAAVAEAGPLGIEVGKRGHHGAGAGPGDAFVRRDERDVADLIAHPRIGELLQRDECVPDGGVRRQPFEEGDWRIARRDHPPGLGPVDAAGRHASAPWRPGCVEIEAHRREIGDVAGAHALQGRLATEGAIRPLDPVIRMMRVGIEQLERLIDAGDVADAAQRIHRHPDGVAGAPSVEGALGRGAEQRACILAVEAPGLHDGEEPAQGRDRIDGLGDRSLPFLGLEHRRSLLLQRKAFYCKYARKPEAARTRAHQ
jgi:hypothetical protein